MIKLNGKEFALNDREFTDSLFTSGGTCAGFYRVNKQSITIMDMQRNKIGVINRHGVLCCATKTDRGYWYSFATIPQIGEYESYMQQVNEPTEALKSVGIR